MERLLERGGELEVLAELVAGAVSGRGGVALVGGEAGIGKTSLVRALRERSAGEVSFFVGACEPLSVPVPLGPMRELAEAAGGSDPFGPGSDDRLVFARALSRALAQRAPAVAVVEDAHWADPATLDLVRLLARRVEEMELAMIVTYRDDEVGANPALGLLLGDLATSRAVRRITLRRLSTGAVAELVGASGVDAGALARVTGGNPFLVVESIAAGGRTPASVRDAALARAGRLGRAARRVVDTAAVIGQRFAPGLLESLVPDSGDAVEEALARGVLVADGAALGFRHELIREAIEGSISPLRRRDLHRRIAAALAQEPGAANARLAHHAELGGLPADAARYAVLAAEEAERVGALREAHLQADRALRLGTDLDPRERLELLLRCSRAANFSSLELEEAVSAAEQAVALARELGDPAGQGRGLAALAWALWSLDRVAAARAAAEQAVAVLEPSGDGAALARAHATLIRMEATAFDPAAAIAGVPRALDLAAAARLEDVRVDVAISNALARGHHGEREALTLLAGAISEVRAAGATFQVVRGYVNLVYVATLLREHAVVDTAAAEALAAFDEYQTTIPAHAVEGYRARSLLDRGRWDEALAIVTRRDREWVSETAVVRSMEGTILARRGDPGGARLIEHGWEELAPVPESSRHGLVRVACVEAAWLRGDHEAARSHVEAAWRSPEARRFARTAGDLAVWAARYGLDASPPPGAPAPAALELAGDWRGAVRAWRELGAPYEAALAALPGDDRAAREALAALQALGAAGAARAFARERSARGARTPRGPRPSTRANAAGLTRREQEILAELAGSASNAAIAERLHLSERTVAHHVSAILRKLGAPNRFAAVEQARARGLLAAQDGPRDGAR